MPSLGQLYVTKSQFAEVVKLL